MLTEKNGMDGENIDFEMAVKRLEEIVNKLEEEELPLEEALKCFQEGVALVRKCNQQLQAVEGQVEILMQQLEVDLQEEGGNKDEMD